MLISFDREMGAYIRRLVKLFYCVKQTLVASFEPLDSI